MVALLLVRSRGGILDLDLDVGGRRAVTGGLG
jgi:hypothetical protein